MGEILVQRGEEAVGLTAVTVDLDPDLLDLDKSFCILANNHHVHGGFDTAGTSVAPNVEMSGRVEQLSTTQIRLSRHGSASDSDTMRYAWELWEYRGDETFPNGNSFRVVGRHALSMGTSTLATSTTLTTTPDDINKCVPFITGIFNDNGGRDWATAMSRAWCSGTNTVHVERGQAASTACTVYVTVVEFGDNWEIGHGHTTFGAGTTQGVNLVEEADGIVTGTAFDVSDWDTAIIYPTIEVGNAPAQIRQMGHEFRRAAGTTSVDVQCGVTMAGFQPFVHVIKHADLRSAELTHSTNTLGEITVAIAADEIRDLSQSSMWALGERNTALGTAQPQSFHNWRLDSLVQAATWGSRGSEPNFAIRGQIADLSRIGGAYKRQGSIVLPKLGRFRA